MEAVIYGHGAHGKDVQEILEANGHAVVGWLDDAAVREPGILAGARFYSGVNDPHARMQTIDAYQTGPAVLHPTAYCLDRQYLDEGCIVAAGAALSNGVVLGRHVHVGATSTLVRCEVGDYTTIGPGVDIGGDVKIGKRVFIGIGARISNLLSIGDGAVIGAGAVVLSDVPAGATAVGVPARLVGRPVLPTMDRTWLQRGAS